MRLQVTGVLATRETFMVSIYDYNKDAEEAEKAQQEGMELSPESSPNTPAVKRNLSGGVTLKSRPCQSAAVISRRAALQWALPAWLLVAILAVALAWDRRGPWLARPRHGEISLAGIKRGLLGWDKAVVLKQ